MEWVIDTDILVRAENLRGGHGHSDNVSYVLENIRSSSCSLAVDYDYKIIGQYYRNLDSRSWVSRLLGVLATRGQITYKSGLLPIGLEDRLRALRFDNDDYVFVAVASKTSDGLLMAEESDYTSEVIECLSDHRIRVLDCLSAAAEVKGRPSKEPPAC